MAGFRIVPRSAMGYAGEVPAAVPQSPAQQYAPAAAAAAPTSMQALLTRLATAEENIRRMHAAFVKLNTEHQKLKAGVQGAMRQVDGNMRELAGYVGAPVVSAPAPQATRGPAARPVAPAAGPGPVMTPAPAVQQNAEEAVAEAAHEMFYGGDADELFYSGDEG